ncbi:MAG: citrate lyase holo-[Oribacterium sp.]|nr:citrate lyase holo-[acyl-carrier protein] synthase [Oribacterium sp.]
MPEILDYSHEVTVPEMMEARDHRVEMQKAIIERTGLPVVCFMLNVPGPHKVSKDFYLAFQKGVERIVNKLEEYSLGIVYRKTEEIVTGYVFYASVDSDPVSIKKAMCEIEEADRLGRIFDIDVIKTDGTKVSREEFGMGPRKCLMCEEEAHFCARNRTHKVSDMVEEIKRIIHSTVNS